MTFAKDPFGGYRGGIDWVEPSSVPDCQTTNQSNVTGGQRTNQWKSCEHNIDIFVAFNRLSQATGNRVWRQRAEHARDFVHRLLDPVDGHLWTGTLLDGATIKKDVRPLDVNPWALLAFEDRATFKCGVLAAADASSVQIPLKSGVLSGFDFNEDKDGIWWEGTAQMELAFSMLGDHRRALECRTSLRTYAFAPNIPGAVLATSTEKLTTGFKRMDGEDWVYWRRPHVGGATCWYIFSELGWNPYWGRKLQ